MGPVFHSHSSQMPLYSVPPPFIPPFGLPLFPPPINDPFVRVFLPRWAGGPQQGQARGLVDAPEILFFLQSIIWVFSIWLSWLFSYLILCLCIFVFLFDCLSLFILNGVCPHLTSRLMDFLNSFPPFCSTHTIVRHFSWKTLLSLCLSSSSPFTLCFSPSLQTLAEIFRNWFFLSWVETDKNKTEKWTYWDST